MKKELQRFLEFNGKRIAVLLADGTWWVAVKPICEALNVNYNRAFQNLQDDEILSQLFAKQQTTGADGKLYQMVCLPERYVYGWLFSIRSESAELNTYKRECYDVLYNHFHGALTGRMTALQEQSAAKLEMLELQEKLTAKMLETPEYLRMQELKAQDKTLKKKLNDIDDDLRSGQLSFLFPSSN